MSPIASDLSYLVLQKRRKDGEVGACALDSSNQDLYPLPSQFVVREAFIADRQSVPDSFQGEAAAHAFDLIPTPTWHRHSLKRK